MKVPKRKFYGSNGNSFVAFLTQPPPRMRELTEGERILGNFILPDFQRKMVWTEKQKVRLIESIYLGLPIGAIVFNLTNDSPCDLWLLDGQQRVSAIIEYMAGEFEVQGYRFTELGDDQKHFLRMGIHTIETNIEDRATCMDIYDRLAYGGSAHHDWMYK